MKSGIFITARLGSTRLKRKHLLPVAGKPLLAYLLERIGREFAGEITCGDVRVVITTSDETENRQFEEFSGLGATVYYGSLQNIPLRHLQAAEHLDIANIIAVDGDDILCSVSGMRQVFDALASGRQYIKTSNLPFGMNSFGYSREFLAASMRGHANDILETGWGRVFAAEKLHDIPLAFASQDKYLRFTLDYEADFAFFKSVIEELGERIITASDQEIVDVVLNRGYSELTRTIMEEYWDNFYRNIEKERSASEKNAQ